MNMNKLRKYASNSSLLNVKIRYDKETFKFNLYDELVINEAKINSELKEQPGLYGFVGLLLVRLQRTKDDVEAEVDKIYATKFIQFKTELNPNTSRENSKDLAECLVKDDVEYQKIVRRFNKVKEDVGVIKQCLMSFEQRSHLLQSLSANRRKEI